MINAGEGVDKRDPPTVGGKVNQCTMANGMEVP